MADQQIVRQVAAVQPLVSGGGKNYWVVTDDQGQEWKVWEPSVAMAAQQLFGQMALMTVRIAPARDPQFGMNYVLKAIAPAMDGMQPSPPIPLAQGPVQQPAQMGLPSPQISSGGMQMMPTGPIPTTQSLPPNMPENLRPPVKTMGQGGQFSDADLTRMARTSAIAAAVGVAFSPEDFRDEEEGTLDWEAVYAVAEAMTKFILFRKHEGWSPGTEINPSNPAVVPLSHEQQIEQEVYEQFPGTVEVPLPGMAPQSSAEQATGGEVGWGEA